VITGAVISPCGLYRYELWRQWDKGPELLWILLNPSTANATEDDPTIRKCTGFSRRWGYSGIRVVNLFAYRATSPKHLFEADDPIGPDNDKVIQSRCIGDCIVAWGNHGTFLNRSAQVLRKLEGRLYCIGLTAKGQPKHPARLGYSTRRQRFSLQNMTKTA
jgi:hypothetical protein